MWCVIRLKNNLSEPFPGAEKRMKITVTEDVFKPVYFRAKETERYGLIISAVGATTTVKQTTIQAQCMASGVAPPSSRHLLSPLEIGQQFLA